MSFALVFTENYTRRAARFIKKHPEIKAQYGKTLELLESNPYHPSLRLHALRGPAPGTSLLFDQPQLSDHDATNDPGDGDRAGRCREP